MATEPQLLFDLFDSYWFAHQIFNKTQTPPPKSPKTEESVSVISQNHDFSADPTINVRCYSDPIVMDSPPNLNLNLNLQTLTVTIPEKNKNNRSGRRRNTSNKSKSKSLSELEFEELKGFMDLGFSFSEKDKDSSLVSMIPGLQRLGKDEKEHVHGYVHVSRPYLSEAWGDLEKIKEEAPKLIRIPEIAKESDIKHQLRFWAHSVASVVR